MAIQHTPGVTASSTGVIVSPDATAHTKPTTYTDLIASTSAATNWITVSVTVTSSTAAASYLLDIATGTAGAEVDVIPNILCVGNSVLAQIRHGFTFSLPLAVASGVRVSARCQCSGASGGDLAVVVHLSSQAGGTAGTTVQNWGADTATSKGVLIDAGATPNTDGVSAVLTASSAADATHLVMLTGTNNNTAETGGTYLFSLTTSTGPEVSYAKHMIGSVNGTLQCIYPTVHQLPPEAIASGSRVNALCQSTVTNPTDRIKQVVVLAGTWTASAGGGGTVNLLHGKLG